MANTLLQQVIEAQDDYALEFRSYSGRGMYGRECLGTVHENAVQCALQIAQAAFALASEVQLHIEYEHLLETLSRARIDSMGMSIIVYWPDIAWEDVAGEFVENDEEDDDHDNTD